MGTVNTVVPGTPSQSSVYCPQNRGRLEADYRSKRTKFLPGAPHFKMEGLYMLSDILKQGWQMAKIDLKDAYLTIPVAREHHCLLSFQVRQGEWVQFQCLPFGICTAPFVFTKVTKPIVQFLRQLGIHLIIYLHDLLLAAPNTIQLLQDRYLSTVLILFNALVFLINYPKSIMHPTQRLEFLGFLVDTKTMRITLSPHKIEVIQKEASRLLSVGKTQIKTLYTSLGLSWQPNQLCP